MNTQRIEKLRNEIGGDRLDALLVSDRVNIEYLTGFRGSYGFLLVNADAIFLFTDSRYYERARKETKGVRIRLVKNDWDMPYKMNSLGFEACSVDYYTYRQWRQKFKGIKFVPTRYLVEKIRMIKEPAEISLIRKAAGITDDVMARVKEGLKTGISGFDLTRKIENLMQSFDDTEPAFAPIVAYGRDSSMPHAGLSGKILRNNQQVLIDIGSRFHSYSSDLTRVFWVGRITRKFEEIYNIVLEAQKLAIEKVAPDASISDIDGAARQYIAKKGYGKYFVHPVGHGIGMSVHEIPRIAGSNRNTLEAGMVFSVEPGIYIPGWGGVRIEDMALVTDKGYSVLTHSPKGLEEAVIER